MYNSAHWTPPHWDSPCILTDNSLAHVKYQLTAGGGLKVLFEIPPAAGEVIPESNYMHTLTHSHYDTLTHSHYDTLTHSHSLTNNTLTHTLTHSLTHTHSQELTHTLRVSQHEVDG